MIATVHVAGPYVDLVQVCTRCGEVLTDWRNGSWEADRPAPGGWTEGEEVVVNGGMSCLRTGWLGLAVPCSPRG